MFEVKFAKMVFAEVESSRDGRRDSCIVVVSGVIGELLVIKIIDDVGWFGEVCIGFVLEKS